MHKTLQVCKPFFLLAVKYTLRRKSNHIDIVHAWTCYLIHYGWIKIEAESHHQHEDYHYQNKAAVDQPFFQETLKIIVKNMTLKSNWMSRKCSTYLEQHIDTHIHYCSILHVLHIHDHMYTSQHRYPVGQAELVGNCKVLELEKKEENITDEILDIMWILFYSSFQI